MANSDMYHHVGASLYFLMSLMWTSGFSLVLLLYCLHIVLPWFRYVYTTRDVMAANESPYEIANVVLPLSACEVPGKVR